VFVDIFKNNIKGIVENSIQSQLAQVIDQVANYFFKNIPTVFQISENLRLDYSLVSSPTIQSTYSTTSHLGAWDWIPNPGKCIDPPPYLPEPLTNKLLTFIISETMGDCLANIFYLEDLLTGIITSSMVPKASPIQLNTNDTTLRKLIPNLYSNFPNASINLQVYATEAPDVIISSANNMLEVTLIGNVIVMVERNDSKYVSAFTLGLTLNAFATIGVSGNTLIGVITKVNQNTTLINSNIGPINVKDVYTLVTVFVGFGVVPILNKLLGHGFPIPDVEGMELINSMIYYGNGFLQVGADFNYNPSHFVEFLSLQH